MRRVLPLAVFSPTWAWTGLRGGLSGLLLFWSALSSAAAAITTPVQIASLNLAVGLGDELRLRVPLALATDGTHRADQLVLFLNDHKLKTLHPVAVNPVGNTVTFKLQRNPDDRLVWNDLLSRPDRDYTKTWYASIGYEDLGPISTSAPVGFMILRATPLNWFWFLSVVLVGSSIWAGLYTGMLMDSDGFYSLGRTQMLFWFWLTVVAFGYIWLVTADRNITIPPSVLGLMGISAATGLAAGFIDDDKKKNAPAVLSAVPGNATTLSLTFMTRVRNCVFDLLHSDGAVDLHRFQIFVWTIVLGIVFVNTVYTELAMPDFDKTLLLLMGVSSGTYIGFKFREQP